MLKHYIDHPKLHLLRGHLFLWSIDNIREWGQELGFKIVKPELRQVRLQDLSDEDLEQFRQKFDDPRQQEIIINEQGRRSRGEPVGIPNVLKMLVHLVVAESIKE